MLSTSVVVIVVVNSAMFGWKEYALHHAAGYIGKPKVATCMAVS